MIAELQSIQYFPVSDEPKAYALVVHGLNNKPAVMLPIIERLNALGIYVLNLCLAGHSDVAKSESDKRILLKAFKKANRALWQKQIRNAIEVLRDLNQSRPRFLVGYSGGAVLTLELIQRHKLVFDKLLLFAPAVSFRNTHRLLRYLPFNTMLIPSLLGEAYRSNRGTPVSAYKAIFSSSQDCHKHVIKTCLNIPTLIVMDPKDEMLSIKGIRRFIAEKALDKWRILPIDGGAGQGNYHHLITSKDFVGVKNWCLIWNEIDQFLNSR